MVTAALPTDAFGNPAGFITAIALDPNNWMTAFVTDNSRVFMTTDAGAHWSDITGNLTNQVVLNARLAVIPGAGQDAVLFGGSGGVFRMLTSAPNLWTKFGAGLPNALVGGMVYNAADDVLVVGTHGRGAWELPNASTSVFTPGVLEIDGDTDFPGENDTIKLVIDASNPALLDVFLNSTTPVFEVPIALLNQINVNGLGGNDTLIVDSSNGLINVPNGINYDGGTGFNNLQLVQTGGATQFSDTYSVGPNPGQGTDVITGPSGTQTVFFQNLDPVTDLVPAFSLLVNGTPANNAIGYTQGPNSGTALVGGATTAQVTIDNLEPIEFANKNNLAISSGLGTDTVGLNDTSTPTNLTAISVTGGDPNANDTLIVNGVAPTVTVDTFGQTITGATGTNGTVPIFYSTIGNLTVNAGAGTTLGVSGSPSYVTTPATAADGGTIQTSTIPISFTGFGSGATLALTGTGGGASLVVNGTAGNDTFTVAPTSGNVAFAGRATITTSAIPNLTIQGIGGNDTFTATAPQPYSSITLAGGGPFASQVGNLIGDGTSAVMADLSGNIPAVTGGGLGSVALPGIGVVNLSAGAGALTLRGTAGGNTFTVTAGATTATTRTGGTGPVVNATTTGPVALDGVAPPSNQLTVLASGAVQGTYTPASAGGGALAVSSGTALTFSNLQSFVYDGQAGGGLFTLVGTAAANLFKLTPGAASDAGILSMDSTLPVTFQNLGASGEVVVNGNGGADALTYYGTSANDTFTVAASTSPVVGGQVNLNSQVPLFTTGIPTLTLEGVAGDDTFTLVPTIAASPYTTLNLHGGPPATPAGSQANLTAAAATALTVSAQTVTQGGNTVAGSGLANENLNAAGNDLTYNSAAGATENINIIGSTAAGQGQVSVPGVALWSFSNVPVVYANGIAAQKDTLTFTGTNSSDTFQINLAAAGTDADPVLKLQDATATTTLLTLGNYTGFQTLNIASLSGADVFNVHVAPVTTIPGRQIFIDGEPSTGKKKLTNVLNVFYVKPRPKIIHSTSQQDSDAGLVSADYGTGLGFFLINFDGIPTVTIRQQ
jgi:hypothetical protein